MSRKKRLVFDFEDVGHKLEKLVAEGPFVSNKAATREALDLLNFLQHWARRGYTELVVRNPDSEHEKSFLVPTFFALAESVHSNDSGV